jgi:DNA-directed RNA polymerase specialized sigma24 family protein
MSRNRALATRPSPDRAELIADVYEVHARRLRTRVASRTGGPPDAIEDACHTAWAILLRRPDISLNARGLAWLTVVAVHEVRHQSAHDLPMGALTLGAGDAGEIPEPAATTDMSVDELAAAHLEHAERVADLAALKPAERTALYLQALGYRYREIGAATDATYTNVISGRSRQHRRVAVLKRRRHVADGGVALAVRRPMRGGGRRGRGCSSCLQATALLTEVGSSLSLRMSSPRRHYERSPWADHRHYRS